MCRLLADGYDVWACDNDSRALDRVVEQGAHGASSPVEVAQAAEIVCLSLPTPEVVRDVVLGESGIIHGSSVKYVVDFSTVGPRTAGAVADALSAREVAYIDAPVSGGIAGARDGRLAVMVACPAPVFADLEAFLKIFGKVFHVGDRAGQAQIMKLANNLLGVSAIALTSEAMVMGVKAGLDPKMMLDIINSGTGRNSASVDKFPRAVLPGTFDFGFATGLSYKDVRLCVDEAEALGVPMVVGAAVREMLAITNAVHGPESDFTSICQVIEGWADVQVRA